MINSLKKVSKVEKRFSVINDVDKVCLIKNLSIKNDKIYSRYTVKKGEEILPSEDILNAFYCGGRFFAFCKDGNLYECSRYTYYYVGKFNTCPSVISFTHNGEEKVLIAGRSNLFILVSSLGYTNISFSQVDKMLLNGGRLFSTLGNIISFSKLYDFTDDALSFFTDGTITIPAEFGNIEYICSIDGDLYVFTDATAFLISCSGESIDFKLRHLENVQINPEKNTFCKVGNSVVFIENGKLYKFSNGTIKAIKTIFDNREYEVIGTAVSNGNKYLVPVSFSINKGVYMFDIENGEQSLVECTNPILASKGYIFDNSLSKVSSIVENKGIELMECEWERLKTNFGTHKNKVIDRIEINTDSNCYLRVSGDFGSELYNVSRKNNTFSVNLPSVEYEFKIFSDSSELKIENLTVIYRERGK